MNVVAPVICELTECRQNRNGFCIFLKENGKSVSGKGKDRMTVMCAWYDRNEKWKCKNCRYSIEREGKTLCLCEKFNQLIPPGRFACKEYRE